VIDNASLDGTKEIIKRHYPRVKLIENSKNLGASKARNQGIDASSGDWILALDNDVVLENDFFEKFDLIQREIPADVAWFRPMS